MTPKAEIMDMFGEAAAFNGQFDANSTAAGTGEGTDKWSFGIGGGSKKKKKTKKRKSKKKKGSPKK